MFLNEKGLINVLNILKIGFNMFNALKISFEKVDPKEITDFIKIKIILVELFNILKW